MTKAEHEAATERYARELRAILALEMKWLQNEFAAQELIAALRSLAERMERGDGATHAK